jgi:dipeptidyl aminopeptidase/acylaminoacyl peptidase
MLKTLLGAAIAWACVSASSLAQTSDVIPVEHFARLPAGQGLSLSPNGDRIAYIAHSGSDRYLVVQSLETGEQNAINISNMRAFETFWADEDTLMARVGRAAELFYISGDLDFQALLTINTDTMDAEQLIREGRDTGFNQNTAQVAGWQTDRARILLPLRDGNQHKNLYAVDPEDGNRRSVVARGAVNTRYWVSDARGERHVRVSYSEDTERLRVAIEENDQWRTLIEERQDIIDLGVVGFSQDGEAVIISRTADEPPYANILQRVELSDGALGEIIFSDPRYDFDSVRIDPYRGYVAGVVIEREQRERIWFDAELAQIQASLEASFAGKSISLIDWTPDRTRLIVWVGSEDQAPVYVLVDLAARSANPVRLTYPELFRASLPQRRSIRYPARDGASIPAYLTVPNTDGPHPFVVLVHGGPASRDYGGFDTLAHMLASQGYGVLQPQFRGSGGYGAQWEAQGWGQWGTGVMQQDVTDAAAYLQQAGLTEQICIAGGSYGGYAALAATVFTPDVFDCAIAFNPVTDAEDFLRYAGERYGRDSETVRYWNRSFSGEVQDRISGDLLRSISPVNYAAQARIPVLLLHGEDDSVVPFRQSRDMHRALQRAGVPVTFIPLEGGDHWLLEYETRLEAYSAIGAFLDEQVGD